MSSHPSLQDDYFKSVTFIKNIATVTVVEIIVFASYYNVGRVTLS